MARLNWKSDALATVIRPLPKGTGDPPKRHMRGNTLKSRIESSIRLFRFISGGTRAVVSHTFGRSEPADRAALSSYSVIPSESEGSRDSPHNIPVRTIARQIVEFLPVVRSFAPSRTGAVCAAQDDMVPNRASHSSQHARPPRP